MSFLDSMFTDTIDLVSDVAETAAFIKAPPLEQFSAAQKVFSAAGERGLKEFNFPKLQYSYIVEFELTPFAEYFIKTQLQETHGAFALKRASWFVYNTDLPTASFEMYDANQYNKHRISTGRIKYKPVSMSFFDTVDSSAYLLMDAYRKFYYGDFFRKSKNHFRNDVLSAPDKMTPNDTGWGRSVMNNGDGDSQYFFKSIRIYEIDNDTFTCHSMHNVFISDYAITQKTQETADQPSLVTLTLNYEFAGNLDYTGYPCIARPTFEIAPVIATTARYGKSGFFKPFGEMDDKTAALGSVGKVIRAGTSIYDIGKSITDILSGNINADTIRNLGNAIKQAGDAFGFDDVLNDINDSFGLGNILGDLF